MGVVLHQDRSGERSGVRQPREPNVPGAVSPPGKRGGRRGNHAAGCAAGSTRKVERALERLPKPRLHGEAPASLHAVYPLRGRSLAMPLAIPAADFSLSPGGRKADGYLRSPLLL